MTNSGPSSKISPPPVLSVSQLNRLARQLLEDHFPAVLVEGEISNLAMPSSGHWYLTLKDQNAQVKCAMFRNRNMFVRFRPRDGMQVVIKAKLSLYEGRGDYQLIIEQLEETGAGALRRAFEQLKQKLTLEGLFAAEHKQAIPALVGHIAVITSPTGAAIRDILSVLRRRFPAIRITIIPVTVQGQGSAAELTRAVELVNQRQGCFADIDVILLGRGGGSLEDLWSFNDEALARAIFNSALPVVSAVGHEVDFTIADYVADVRAATPSAAAELLSPDQHDYLQVLKRWEMRLIALIRDRLMQEQKQVQSLARHLRHPGRRLQQQAQRLDELELRLRRSMVHAAQLQRTRLVMLQSRLKQCNPQHLITQHTASIRQLDSRMARAIRQVLSHARQQLSAQGRNLHAVSPLATLARGYSITRTSHGELLRSYEQVKADAIMLTELNTGFVLSQVITTGESKP